MAFVVINPGVQATLQAKPRCGTRHLGVAASGPADALSMALANRLVGNPSDTCCLELPFGLFSMRALSDSWIAFTGADAAIEIDGAPVSMHQGLSFRAGETVTVGAASTGVRIYLAVAGGFAASIFLGSRSTYAPAGFGGFEGRALKAEDILETEQAQSKIRVLTTPSAMRQKFTHSLAIRCVPGPDEHLINGWEDSQDFTATRRADRTGIEVAGSWPQVENSALKASAPVFPGAIQLTPSGAAFILLPDAQTTGGYPHVLQVTRADRHLLGQIRPGDRIRFLRRNPEQAAEDLRRKTELFRKWLPDLML